MFLSASYLVILNAFKGIIVHYFPDSTLKRSTKQRKAENWTVPNGPLEVSGLL